MSRFENQPHFGKNRELVLEELKKGNVSHPKIVEATGLGKKAVSRALFRIYDRGEYPRPSNENRQEAWKASHPGGVPLKAQHRELISRALTGIKRSRDERLAVSETKGGGWFLMEDFAFLGFATPSELREAVFVYMDRDLKKSQVLNAIEKARIRGDIPRPTDKEKERALSDRTKSRETIRERVRLQFEDLKAETTAIAAMVGLDMPWDFRDQAIIRHYFYASSNNGMEFFQRRWERLSYDKQKKLVLYLDAINCAADTNKSREFLHALKTFIQKEDIERVFSLAVRARGLLNGNISMPDNLRLQIALGLFLYMREESVNGDVHRGLEVGERFINFIDILSDEEQKDLAAPMKQIMEKTQKNGNGKNHHF